MEASTIPRHSAHDASTEPADLAPQAPTLDADPADRDPAIPNAAPAPARTSACEQLAQFEIAVPAVEPRDGTLSIDALNELNRSRPIAARVLSGRRDVVPRADDDAQALTFTRVA